MSQTELTNRLNRAIGQVEGIKKKLETGQAADCAAVLQQLKAAIGALKKFGEAYIHDNLTDCLYNNPKDIRDLEKNLKEVLSSAFQI